MLLLQHLQECAPAHHLRSPDLLENLSARFLNELRLGTQVVWIACEPHLQNVSSSSLRELESIEPGATGRYIPTASNIYFAAQESPDR
jgi:hypothetical protein